MNRTIGVGDIHGCYDELQQLLDAARIKPDDRLIALGDIVDRGPNSEAVLEFLSSRPNTLSLMGNHERKHVRSYRGEVRPALSQQITEVMLGARYSRWISFMEGLPRYIELDEAILVHGFFEPGIDLEDQRDDVVVGTMSGEGHLHRTLPGPWYEFYDNAKPIVVGHRDYLGTGNPLVRDGRVYAIDTACYSGGRLTALIIPGFACVSVPSGGDHWSALKRRYSLLARSGRADVDLDWETLSDYAEAAEDPSLPDSLGAEAIRFAALKQRCEWLTQGIRAEVERQHRLIIADLEPGWGRWTERERSARYAGRAKRYENSRLFFLTLRGALDAEAIWRLAKTPRGLGAMAKQLMRRTEENDGQ